MHQLTSGVGRKLAAETEADESRAIGRQMDSSSEEACFEIEPKGGEGNAEDGLKIRVRGAEPKQGALKDCGA
jgi:hypothetical protein